MGELVVVVYFRIPQADGLKTYPRILAFAVFFPAEMWGVLKGIIFALGKGYMKIELQTYNKSIVEAINKRYLRVQKGNGLFHQIKNCLNEEWEFIISHVHREVNHNADAMDNKGLHYELSLMVYGDYPDDLIAFLSNDIAGNSCVIIV